MDGEVRDSPRIEFSVLFRRKIATSRQISLLINKVAFMVWDDSGEAGSQALKDLALSRMKMEKTLGMPAAGLVLVLIRLT